MLYLTTGAPIIRKPGNWFINIIVTIIIIIVIIIIIIIIIIISSSSSSSSSIVINSLFSADKLKYIIYVIQKI